jgi:predicted O-methyltransferase YrrM
MSTFRTLKHQLRDHAGPVYRALMIPLRLATGLKHTGGGVGRVFAWSLRSREDTNFTYSLSETNQRYLAHMIAVVSGAPVSECRRYIEEAASDADLHRHVVERTLESPFRGHSDAEPRFARRLGWYALVRLMRPRLVVETGVDKGLGSVLLCSALLRNAQDGYPGEYRGTDINPAAGWLLSGTYATVGGIMYGDSIASREQLTSPIDLFINDSDHSASYEAREYETIAGKLSRDGIILGDNAHVSDALQRFSESHARDFLYFQEEPVDHWYPGAGIGFSFKRKQIPN